MPKPAVFLITDEQRYRWMASTNNQDTLRELQMLPPVELLTDKRIDAICERVNPFKGSVRHAVVRATEDEILFGANAGTIGEHNAY